MAEAQRQIIPITDPAAIAELTTRGVAQVYPSQADLTDEMMSGRRLNVYMGIDPTGPDVHIGHASQLQKLERFRQLGHNVTLLFGGTTATIGDPTDRSAKRVALTENEVDANAATYRQQASKILDIDNEWNPVTIRNNREWFKDMGLRETLELMSQFTVSQILDRDDFKNRMEAELPVWYHETFYPLLQGYDSVALKTDVEVGGSDQTFNMLAGTKLVRRLLGKQKYIVAGELLADPDGDKMGKTSGNMITLNDPPLTAMQRIMAWGDKTTPVGLTLCTTMPLGEIAAIKENLESGTLTGQDGKKILAHTILSELHGPDAAERGEQQYRQLIEQSEPLDPTIFDFQEAHAHTGTNIVDILIAEGLVPSRNEARRLLKQNGIYINERPVTSEWTAPDGYSIQLLRRGKRDLANYRKLQIIDPREPTPASASSRSAE